jgi:hypothetical protein
MVTCWWRQTALYRAKMAGRNLIAEAQRLRQHEVTRT